MDWKECKYLITKDLAREIGGGGDNFYPFLL